MPGLQREAGLSRASPTYRPWVRSRSFGWRGWSSENVPRAVAADVEGRLLSYMGKAKAGVWAAALGIEVVDPN
jgi:hypothetical protein